jgi:SLT domain-containing protein
MEKWHQEQRSYKVEDQVKKKDAANYLHGYREKNIGKTASNRASSAARQISTTVGSSSQVSDAAYPKAAASTGFQASATTAKTNPERRQVIDILASGMGRRNGEKKKANVSNITKNFCINRGLMFSTSIKVHKNDFEKTYIIMYHSTARSPKAC